VKITELAVDGLLAFAVEGDLDHSSVPAFRDDVSSRLSRASRLLIDLSGCDFIDSGGLGELMACLVDIGDEGCLAVIAPRAPMRRLFEVAGLTRHERFLVFEDREAAEHGLAASGCSPG